MTIEIPNPTPGLTAHDSMTSAGLKVLRLHYQKMQDQQEGVLEGVNIEAVHDMRVAIRRMRVALRVFKRYFPENSAQDQRKQLQDVGQALGPLRDMDVFLYKTHLYLGLHAVDQETLSGTLNFFRSTRQELHTGTCAYLESPAYAGLLKTFEGFLEITATGAGPSVAVSAPQLIRKRLNKVRSFEQDWQQADYPTLHRLRIAFKRLRYTIEFFEDVLGEQQYAAIELLKEIQDHLGDLNDSHVALRLLGPLPNDYKNPHTLAYVDYRQAERDTLTAGFPLIWQRFTEGDFENNLRAALNSLAPK